MKMLSMSVTTDKDQHFTLFCESEQFLRVLGWELVWLKQYKAVELLGPDTKILGRCSEETDFQWMTLRQIAAEIQSRASARLDDRIRGR